MVLKSTKDTVSSFDKLSRERTLLANERTWLAYVRTGLSFFLLGIGLIKLFDEVWVSYLGVVSLIFGIVVIVVGAAIYPRRNKEIRRM
jgi:putative membrane protein